MDPTSTRHKQTIIEHKWCAKWKQMQYSYFSCFMLCCNFSFSLFQKAISACSWLVSDETFFFPLKVDITDKVKHKIGEFGNIELYLNVTYLKGNIACQTFTMEKIVFFAKTVNIYILVIIFKKSSIIDVSQVLN